VGQYSMPMWVNFGCSLTAVACLTPWVLGGNRLPKDSDMQRIRELTSQAYISSGSSNRPQMDSSQFKRLSDMAKNIKLVDSGFGAVRLRKLLDESSWKVELFGNAQKI